jgi:hypothetical protein
LIGRRNPADRPDEPTFEDSFTDFDLTDGDILRVGKVAFRVGIQERSEMPDHQYQSAGY